MIHRQSMGSEGLLMALLASAAMVALAHFVGVPPRLGGDMGICLPSPNAWGMSDLWGWAANTIVLAITVFTLYIVNREFTFVQGSDTVMTGMFAIMVSSNLWTSGCMSTSGLFALANLICITLLFGCYGKRNASQELCVTATIISLGTMIQYAFIFLLPVYLIAAGVLKCLRFKSFIAYLLGIIAPYWVALGMGIVRLEDFTVPTMTNLFNGFTSRPTLLVGGINIGITVLLTLILALGNMVRLYAGNTQRRLYNLVIDILGLACVLCMIFDTNNMVVYLCTLYMIAAIQLGNLFALRSIYRGGRWLMALSVLYVIGLVLMVFYDAESNAFDIHIQL